MRNDITHDPGEDVVFEIDGQDPLLTGPIAGFLEVEVVVPAIGVKHIGDERRAQHEANLVASHSNFQLVHHLLGDGISLLKVRLIDAEATGTQGGNEQQQ